MPKSRKETWLALSVLAIALIPIAALGVWGYIVATAIPLHPNAQEVSSSALSPPLPRWSEQAERGRQIARDAISQQNVPGLSVAVGVDSAIVWAEGFGWADLESQAPVTADTTFRIGTASVPLTSAAVGALVEEGRLRLDEPIQSYVKEFPRKPWPLTLRQLMAHTAGLVTDGGDEGALFTEHCEHPTDSFKHFAGQALRFEPGIRYRHSNYGWIVVSAAVEAAAQRPFLAFMQSRVFEPLDMRRTDADGVADPALNRATPYFPRFAAEPRYGPQLMRPLDYSCYSGASMFVSTPSDLVRFGMAMNNGTLLHPETVGLLQASGRLASGEETGHGLGWELGNLDVSGTRTQWAGYAGEVQGGSVASLLTFPKGRIAVAVISNMPYADTQAVAAGIAQIFASARADAGGPTQ